MPQLSIIVPVYNVEKYLRKCIESIISQTFSDFELILVDDGSPDKSPKICDEYAQKDSRIKVIHKKNGGLMSAWKAGFGLSKGKFIGFVDSDDWIDPEMYEKMSNTILEDKADMVQCDIIQETKNPNLSYCKIKEKCCFTGNQIIDDLLPKVLNYWETDGMIFVNSRCNKLIKRELIESNLKYCNEKISNGEDLNLILPIILDCKKIMCVPCPHYHYRVNQESLTRQAYKKNYTEQVFLLISSIQSILNAKKISIDILGNKLYNYLIMAAIENEIESGKTFFSKIKEIKILCQNQYKPFLYQLKFNKLRKKYKFIYLIYRYNLYPFIIFL